ncbi:MAG: alginate export family protein, partial [bacterium]|nr:alginate export family protein [bacterium]
MKHRLTFLTLLCVLNIILFHLTPARSEDNGVKFSGQIRSRGEMDQKDFDSDTSGGPLSLFRVRLNAAFQPADKIYTFIQLQDSRERGFEPSTLADTHNVDLHQAYVQVNDLFIDKLTFKIGRMELSYAGQRLIGAFDWHNVGR